MRQLLTLVTSWDQILLSVEERRTRLLQELAKWIDAKVGFWGWGRGKPLDSTVAPVASIQFGFSKQEWLNTSKLMISPDAERLFNHPIRLRHEHQSHVTVSRTNLGNDSQWNSEPLVTQGLHQNGWDNFLISVKYFKTDSWTNLSFLRALGKPDFSLADLELVELAMDSVAWMQPRVGETIAASAFEGLTHRQTTVMFFLLDGMSRKQIAAELGVSLHTINDSCKELYLRFSVNSATELSAKFLRSV